MWYGYAADLLVAVHFAYVWYVIIGQFLIVAAAPMKWQWARNPWFRFTHLLAIVIVATEAIAGWACPLTVWEGQLRELAGQPFDGSTSFMGRLVHDMLFFPSVPQIVFDVGYVAVALLVVQALIMYPPRWFRFGKRPASVAETKVEPVVMGTA